jgi:hypothetical protein
MLCIDNVTKFPVSNIQLGRDVVPLLILAPPWQAIIKTNGQVMYRTYGISLTPDDIQSPSERKEREAFDSAIGVKYGLPMNEADFKDALDYAAFVTPTYYCYEDDEIRASNMPDIDDVKDKDYVGTYDKYSGSQLKVTIGDEIRTGKVVRRKRELDDTVKGDPMPSPCWKQGPMRLSSLVAAVMSILQKS